MRLPEIAARLMELSRELNCFELAQLAVEIGRRPGQRTPPASARCTPALRVAIWRYKLANPHASHRVIGEVFNVNTGRVSEALRGKRT